VGGALVAIGSFLPYVSEVTLFGLTISRNAFQLGQGLSMTYDGPLIVFVGLMLALEGLVLRGVIKTKSTRPWSPIVVSIVGGLIVFSSWMSQFPASKSVVYSHGFGGVVSLVGVLCGFVATYIRRQGLKITN
jgi:hypothetical protein